MRRPPALTYRQVDGAVAACAHMEAGSGADTTGLFDEDEARASEALPALKEVREVLRGGGVVLALTKAELNQLRHAAGNSTSDPDWYKSMCQTRAARRALMSVSEKVGFAVVVPDASFAALNRRKGK